MRVFRMTQSSSRRACRHTGDPDIKAGENRLPGGIKSGGPHILARSRSVCECAGVYRECEEIVSARLRQGARTIQLSKEYTIRLHRHRLVNFSYFYDFTELSPNYLCQIKNDLPDFRLNCLCPPYINELFTESSLYINIMI